MPVNQPQIAEDPVQAAWDLELTQLINELEQRINDLEARVEELESAP